MEQKKRMILIAFLVMLSLFACSDSSSSGEISVTDTVFIPTEDSLGNVIIYSSSSSITDTTEVEEIPSDGSAPVITVQGTEAVISNDNGCVENSVNALTITCSGDYYLTGSGSDFQIIVNTLSTDAGNVGLYLNNLSLVSSGAPILVKNAERTVIHLMDGTVNSLEDGSVLTTFTKADGTLDTVKAAIYSKDDLNIKGSGTLTVTGNANSGIHCTNDIKIKNGNITVNALNHGIKGKGSVQISGGTLNISATNGDAIKSDEGEEEGTIVDGKGVVEISGGKINITKAGDDGIQAYNYVLINDSSATANVTVQATAKAIVSDNYIHINGGTINATSATDDGIHSNLNIYLNAGNITISAGDDGVHADSTLYLRGATVNVVQSTEGLEAYYIRAEAGMTSVYGTDDGWNAAGGTDGSGAELNGWGSMGGMSSTKGYIVISGGYHYISASGGDIDVLDANGTATQTGGVLILENPNSSAGGGSMGGRPGSTQSGSCSTNQSGGLIDTDSGYSITGGIMLGFGSQTEEFPSCTATSYTAGTYYGSSNAAFAPQGSGSMIIYGGSITSVSAVDVSQMTEITFPNGLKFYEN